MHPLKRFKLRKKKRWQDLADICKREGWDVSANLLAQIGMGYYQPSFNRCEFIAKHVLGSKDLALRLYRFPYTRPKSKKSAA